MRHHFTKIKSRLAAASTLIFLVLCVSACGIGLNDDDRIERAQVAFENQEYRAAIIDLMNVLQNSPDNAVARKRLGLAQAADGDQVSAAAQFQRALDLGQPIDDFRVPFAEALVATGQLERALEISDPAVATSNEVAFKLWIVRGDAYSNLGAGVNALRSFAHAEALDVDNATALLRSAKVYWDNGNYRDARAFAEQALEVSPENIDGQMTLGRIRYDQGDFAGAEQDYQHAFEVLELGDVDRGYFLAYLAEAHLAQGNTDAARQATEQIVGLWSDDSSYLRSLNGQIALAAGDFASAARDLQAYLVRFPNWIAGRRMLGQAQFQLGLVNQAESQLRTALADDPDQIEARKWLARLYLFENQDDSAREMLKHAFATGARDAELLGLLALVNSPTSSTDSYSTVRDHLIQGDLDGIVIEMERQVSARPNEAGAHHLLGLAQLSVAQFEEAIDSFKRVGELDPDDLISRQNLALAYLGQSDLVSGLTILDEIRTADTADSSGEIRRALLLDLLKAASPDEEFERSTVTDWLDQNPEDADVRLWLAWNYLDADLYAEASEQYEILLQKGSESGHIHGNLAWSYLELGDPRARAQAELAYELDPDDPFVLDTLGWILVSEAELEKGISLLRDAQLLEPDNTMTTYHLAYALAGNNAEEEALVLLNDILKQEASRVTELASDLLRSLGQSPQQMPE